MARKRDFFHTGLDVSRSECNLARMNNMIGLGFGEKRYLVSAKSAADLYYRSLIDNGVAERDIYTTIAAAHADMSANQNDVLFGFPGQYVAADVAWSKDMCHFISLGTHRSNWYGSGGDVIVHNTAITGVSALNVTADFCKFSGLNIINSGANAACVSAVKDAGHDNHYFGCLFLGHIRAEQAGAALAADFWVDTTVSAAGHGLILENCYVGSSGCYTRTSNNTQLLFGPTGIVAAGSNVTLRNTMFGTRTKTAGCSAIKFAADYTVDRLFLIDNCAFYNFYDENDITSTVTEAINDDCATTHKILVKGDSVITGYAAWESVRGTVYLSGPAANGGSGIATVET